MPRNHEAIEEPKSSAASSWHRDVDDRADREPDDPDERRIGTAHSARGVEEDEDQLIGRAHPSDEELDETDVFVRRSSMSSARRDDDEEEELDDGDIIEELDLDDIQDAERDDH